MHSDQTSRPAVAPTASPLLDHERLDAYRVAVALDDIVVTIARRAPRGHAWLAQQAQEASGSAVLNLAEAVGRQGADRTQRFRYSRSSALEVDAALTLLCHRGACVQDLRATARDLTVRLVCMLTRLMARAG
jgi:four helix bundle protein